MEDDLRNCVDDLVVPLVYYWATLNYISGNVATHLKFQYNLKEGIWIMGFENVAILYSWSNLKHFVVSIIQGLVINLKYHM